MLRMAVLAVAACGGTAPSSNATEPTEPVALKPLPPSDRPLANVALDTAPPPKAEPTPTSGTATARPCVRKAPIVFTVATDTRTHEQLCTIVDDYITFLGAPSLRAPDLALQLTATLTEGATLTCKLSVEVHLRTKLVMSVDGGGNIALQPTDNADVARDDCMRAVVNDLLGRQIVPALVRAGVTGPSGGSGAGSGSGATP